MIDFAGGAVAFTDTAAGAEMVFHIIELTLIHDGSTGADGRPEGRRFSCELLPETTGRVGQ